MNLHSLFYLNIRNRIRQLVKAVLPDASVKPGENDMSGDEKKQPSLDSEYAQRIAAEKSSFDDCLNVHDLPDIFHYWSNKHLAPKKLHPFGITDPEQFYFLYTQQFHSQYTGQKIEIASVGCGNCDMEVRLAKRLIESEITNFQIDCIDINEVMLERGKILAKQLKIEDYINPIQGDFNHWKPIKKYHLVIANQSLHHVLELEELFDTIKNCLHPNGFFLTSDMIGRNGHQRWPEALIHVQEFWQELPSQYRFNRLLKRHEPAYINHDCSTEGFEGVRSQDILPLLIKNFSFELFIPFANLVMVFIDRPFGHNFNIENDWDRDFIDRVHAKDEELILSGEIKPTQMLAAMCLRPTKTKLVNPELTPEFCVRAADSNTSRKDSERLRAVAGGGPT